MDKHVVVVMLLKTQRHVLQVLAVDTISYTPLCNFSVRWLEVTHTDHVLLC